MLICQLTDLHVRPAGKPANRVSETNMFTERAFRAVARLNPRPDVVVITGDLTECGLDAEYANLNRLLRKFLPMPVFVIPGNHDRRGNFREGLKHLPGVTGGPALRASTPWTNTRSGWSCWIRWCRAPGTANCAPSNWSSSIAPWPRLRTSRPSSACTTRLSPAASPTWTGSICGTCRNSRRSSPGIRQVERIICGHHHRPIVARLAHAIASIAPSVAHQVEMTLNPHDSGAFIFEPPAFQLHRWTAADGIVSHTVYVEDFPGPYPFVNDPDYPGKA